MDIFIAGFTLVLDPTYIELCTRYVRKDNFDSRDIFALTTLAIRGHQSLSAQAYAQTALLLSPY